MTTGVLKVSTSEFSKSFCFLSFVFIIFLMGAYVY